MSDDKSSFSIKNFYEITTIIEKDDSPEGEYEAVRISQARSSLFLDMPFFGYILGNLEIYPTIDPQIASYACDTRRIYFNRFYTTDKKKEQLKGILMHLVIHLIMQHGKRMEGRNTDIWGMSSDISTRLIVEDAREKLHETQNLFGRRGKKPADSIWDTAKTDSIPNLLRYESADQVYKILHDYAHSLEGIQKEEEEEEEDDEPKGPVIKKNWRSKMDPEILDEVQEYSGLDDMCNFGYTMELFLDGISDEFAKLEDNRFNGIIRNGLAQQRDAGKLPGAIKEVIDELLNPKVPWYTLLSQYIQKTVISDWIWTRPNKRMIGMDMNLPSTIKENLEVVVAVDTSGSISSEELRDFTSEVHAIISSVSEVKMTLIDCDYIVQQVLVIESGQTIDGSPLPWEGRPWKGRGGTSFVPVFNWVEENGLQPDLLIYFTDGYGAFPNAPPNFPTVWIMTTNVTPPFGELIEYTK